jgi:SAM-dependent methyltransferase
MITPMTIEQDWLQTIIVCPECGNALMAGLGQGDISCPNATCGYRSWRAGRVYNLLPRQLDEFQVAENDFRASIFDQYAVASSSVDQVHLNTFQILNVLCYHNVTSQYFFFRDVFAKRHQLRGRGLEIGGGTGHISGFIKLFYPGTEMVTSDIAPINMAFAEQLANRLQFDTDYFVTADAERLPFAAESFDFIFSSSMLHHLGDMRRALECGRSALKSGGRWYVINELALGSIFRLYWNGHWGTKGKLGRLWQVHENSYTFKEWITSFEQAGFCVVDVHFPRKPKYKLLSWQRALYYTSISWLPASLLKMGIPCEVNVVLQKR